MQVGLKWKSMENPKERAITYLHAPTGSWDIEIQNHKHERRHFPDFKPHFRINEYQYDVTVEQLKTMER